MNTDELLEGAKAVLDNNDHGDFTIPAPHLYSHQWLWDSCFIAIGRRHLHIDRAQKELTSLLRGQWSNGMMPNLIIGDNNVINRRSIWRSWVNTNSPDNVITSGITQPPMLAEAVVKIGQKLKKPEQRSWYKLMYPGLLAYHQWLYKERDPHKEGLILLIHPWEVGMDNTPPWMNEIHEHALPLWIKLVEKAHLGPFLNLFRRDTHTIPAEQRLDIIDALVLFSSQRRLRRKQYDSNKILSHAFFSIEDLAFNCIFIRANAQLRHIAKTLNRQLPEELTESMGKTEKALEQLWDPYTNQYYSRNFSTHSALKESTLTTLLPLYAGTITKERAKTLVKLLEDQHSFGTSYPVPSVPANSDWFKPTAYWQGPAWVNTNWLIIEGLRRYGFKDHADALTESTLEMVSRVGFSEYFNPLTGEAAGAHNFSWTAALVIDLLNS